MTPLHTDLEELLRLAEEATPGEWKWSAQSGHRMPSLDAIRSDLERVDPVCSFGDDSPYYPTEGTPPEPEDQVFIAAARNFLTRHGPQLAALVGENERLATELRLRREDLSEAAVEIGRLGLEKMELRAELAAREKDLLKACRLIRELPVKHADQIYFKEWAAEICGRLEADDLAKGEK